MPNPLSFLFCCFKKPPPPPAPPTEENGEAAASQIKIGVFRKVLRFLTLRGSRAPRARWKKVNKVVALSNWVYGKKGLKGKEALNKWRNVNKQVIGAASWRIRLTRAIKAKAARRKWTGAKTSVAITTRWKTSMPTKLKLRANLARWKRANEAIISTRKWRIGLPDFIKKRAAASKWNRLNNKVKAAESLGIDVKKLMKEKNKKTIFSRWRKMYLKFKLKFKRDPEKRKKAKKQWKKSGSLLKFLVKPKVKPMTQEARDRFRMEREKREKAAAEVPTVSNVFAFAVAQALSDDVQEPHRDDISNNMGTAIRVASAVARIKNRTRSHRLQAIGEDEALEEIDETGDQNPVQVDDPGVGVSRTSSRRGSILGTVGSGLKKSFSRSSSKANLMSQSPDLAGETLSRPPSRGEASSPVPSIGKLSRSQSRMSIGQPESRPDSRSEQIDQRRESDMSSVDEIARMKTRMTSKLSRKPSTAEIDSVNRALGRLSRRESEAVGPDDDVDQVAKALSRLASRKQSSAYPDDPDDHVARALSRLQSSVHGHDDNGVDLASQLANSLKNKGRQGGLSKEEMSALTEAIAGEMGKKDDNATAKIDQQRADSRRGMTSRAESEKQLGELRGEVRQVLKMIREADEIKKKSKKEWDKLMPIYRKAWESTEVPTCVLDLMKAVRYNPPKTVLLLLEAICVLKGIQPDVTHRGLRKEVLEVDYRPAVQKLLVANLSDELYDLRNSDQISLVNIVEFQERIMRNPDFSRARVIHAFPPAGILFDWLLRIERYAKISLEVEEVKRMRQLANSLRKQGKITLKQLKLDISELEGQSS